MQAFLRLIVGAVTLSLIVTAPVADGEAVTRLSLDQSTPLAAWQRFVRDAGGQWRGEADRATGGLFWARGSGIPWTAGRGNALQDHPDSDAMAALVSRAEAFARDRAALLGLTGFELAFDAAHSRSFGTPPYLHILLFRVLAFGIPVQGARVAFVVNNGNLTSFSVDAPPLPPARIPPALNRDLADRLSSAELVRRGEVSDPESRPTDLVWRFSAGKWTLAWEGLVRDRSTGIPYQVTTSAASGEVLEVRSLRAYGQATGGVRLRLRTDPQTLMPLRGVTVTDGTNVEVTDAAGRFRLMGASLSGTLSGPHATLTDGCGSTTISGDSTGLAFGSTFRTDCVSSVPSAPGDNSASRTAFWHVNRIRDLYRAYDTQAYWLDTPVGIRSNVMEECANYFDAVNINIVLNSQGGTCSNAGDGGQEVVHEWGHAYQWKTRGFFADAATREAYGNVTSLLQFHNHCIGESFWLPGYFSEANTPCTGFQETDFTAYASPGPALPQNIGDFPYSCPPDTSLGGGGIIGYEGHCEGHIMTQAMYELGTALAQKYGAVTGWDKLMRLWIAAGPLQNHAWNLVNAGPPVVADGCPAWTWFESLRTVDDDDGNLSNGVPNGAEIFAAFNNHGIACASDPFVDVDVATCPAISAPAVTLSYSAADDSELVSWTPVAGASGYRVLRSELGPEGAFTPIATIAPGTTSFVDADGTALAVRWYTVVALGTGNCESVLAVVVRSTDCVPAVALAEPFSLAAVDPASVTLSWTRGSNASAYDLYLSPSAEPSLFERTAETSATIPAGTLAPGATYRWKVTASSAAPACSPAVSEIRSFVVSGTAALPTLSSVNPATGPTSGGTSLTLSGTNLYLGASVTMGGRPAAAAWVDPQTLRLLSPPADAPGNVDIVVTNPGGQTVVLTSGFSYFVVAPVATTGAASGIGQTTATLNGTVNPNGASTTTAFEYGTTTAYGSTVSALTLTGSAAQSISAGVTPLACETVYHFRARGTNSAGTGNGLDATVTTATCPAPVATTGAASLIGQTTATLNGTVNPNGALTTTAFEYGTTTAYGSTVSALTLTGSTAQSISAGVTGLACETAYHFRARGTNAGGTGNGLDATVTTSTCPAPVVTTGAASLIGQTAATLNGTVNPNGASTTTAFEYGTTTAYGSTVSAQTLTGLTAQAISAGVSGLACETAYHFRAKGTNSGGTGNGSDLTFTTSGCAGTSFYTVQPCRLLDTRAGGPALAAMGTRTITLDGRCGIPPGAKALSANITVITPAASGDLVLYPADAPSIPVASSISFRSGRIRANNALVSLAANDGGFNLTNTSVAQVNFIVDVNGYFK